MTHLERSYHLLQVQIAPGRGVLASLARPIPLQLTHRGNHTQCIHTAGPSCRRCGRLLGAAGCGCQPGAVNTAAALGRGGLVRPRGAFESSSACLVRDDGRLMCSHYRKDQLGDLMLPSEPVARPVPGHRDATNLPTPTAFNAHVCIAGASGRRIVITECRRYLNQASFFAYSARAAASGVLALPRRRCGVFFFGCQTQSSRLLKPAPTLLQALERGRSYARFGAFLDADVAAFDASAFRLARPEAVPMDPHARLLLELTLVS